jgi:hypothetical protein
VKKQRKTRLSDNLINRITNPTKTSKLTFITIVDVKKNSVTRNVSVLLEHNNKTAGKLYPTIPCNNPESDTG